MNLFVAEKPSLARAIAEVLGNQKPSNGCIYCSNNNVVTWCFGHLLEIVNNKDKKWDEKDLPILPNEWLKLPKDAASEKQIKIIKTLSQKSDVVINAGDPDREGQLLVDEVLDYIKYKGKVLRLWVQALDRENMQKAINKMVDNSKYRFLRLSAEARSHADWLVGINLTMVYTLSSKKFVSIGRVQTPTLKLITDRDNVIANFKPKDYFVLNNKINNTIESTLITKELPRGIDEENRIIDKDYAISIAKTTSNTKGKVVSVRREKKTQYPPMPFMLSTLQKYMSEHHGFSAKETLDVLQALYEKKLVTYPRTDCAYLPQEQFSDAPIILKNISNYMEINNAKPNLSIKHKAWDSSKLSAHSGIMPTKDFHNAGTLTTSEQVMFKVILKSFFCLFFEPYQYMQTIAVFNISGYNFQSIVNTPINLGFLVCTSVSEPPIKTIDLKEGDIITSSESVITDKQTTPPAHFTDGSIIEAMSHIHRFIDDEKAKSILKETDGIGTEATRASTIETLIKRGFVKRQNKSLVSIQPFANSFLNNLPAEIQNPVLTAQWESKLSDIANNKYSIDNFESEQKEFVAKIVNGIKGHTISIADNENKQTNTQNKQNNYKQTKYSSNKQNKQRPAPTQTTLSCPDCGKPLFLSKTKNGKDYYSCRNCKSAFWTDSDGSVGRKWDIKLTY